MKLLKALWGWIRRDGLLHAETSTLLVAVFSPFMPLWLAAVLAFVCGIGWEVVGKRFGGVANWHDIICDGAGVIFGSILVTLMKIL